MARTVKAIVEHGREFDIPMTVPTAMHQEYRENYLAATCSTGRLFLFAGDQKIEHLNKDFYGKNISEEAGTPEHLFEIASKSRIGIFATQLGMIARYAHNYRSVFYLVKMNSKTDLVPVEQQDPCSLMLNSVEQVIEFKKRTGLPILGVGYTLYLGSSYEARMLQEAARLVYEAHAHGLIVVLWCYPRGKAIINERDASVIAGAAGVATCLGADFVKINVPDASDSFKQAELLIQATRAAGNTKVVCSGGGLIREEDFLASLYHQIHSGGVSGAAIGRNIHQKKLAQAINFSNAVAAIVFDDAYVEDAKKLLSK